MRSMVGRPQSARGIAWTLLLLFLLGSGCRSIPAVDSLPPPKANAGVRVLTADGDIDTRSSSKLAAFAGDRSSAVLHHHLALMEAQGGPPLVTHNSARLLIDGPATYAATFGAIAQARRHVNLEMYIFQDDEVGRDLAELLIRKQREGVQVNIIYDSVGSLSTPADFFERMRAAGINVLAFNPVQPQAILDLNNRDHRKMVIVDGMIAFTGGINISSVYSRGSSSARRNQQRRTDEGWRDTQIEIRGPAAAEFQRLFLQTWKKLNGPPLPQAEYFPEQRARGDKLVRVIGSSPDDKVNLIYADWLTAIEQAQDSIHLTMAYFVPDRRTIDALCKAARRGVDVKIVLPGFSDWWVVFHAGRAHYDDLLEAGVKIYERRDALLHAKTAVVDGVWSTVGSANMDMRSFLHNDEVNAVVLGDDFGAEMEAMFKRDLEQSTPVDLRQWRRRAFVARSQELFSRLWAYWL